MRYRLRTLLIVLGVAPPLLAGVWFVLPVIFDPAMLVLLAAMAGVLATAVVIQIVLTSLGDAAIDIWQKRRP